ncbi:MAG: PaaX family transcriptional regulator C-terminal domain-containing protein [Verrucomicrobiia bacterium]
MKLGYKTRVLLDMILVSGVDALEFLTYPTKSLVRAGGWESERNMTRHFKTMRDKGWIVWDDSRETGKWVVRITEAGKKLAQEDVDPETYWSRQWDVKWRLIAFDLPASKQKLRRELLLWLKARRFGRLQDSLWVTPHFEESWYEDLVKLNFDPSGVSFVEGVSFATSSTSDFVEKSWDFEEISRRYTELIDFHNSTISFKLDNEYTEWLQKENFLWREAFKMDPFLPDELLPSNYKGKKALAARKRNYTALFER